MPIDKSSLLAEAFKKIPGAARIFRERKMGCASCQGRLNESIAWGAQMHGVDPDELVSALKSAAKADRKAKK